MGKIIRDIEKYISFIFWNLRGSKEREAEN